MEPYEHFIAPIQDDKAQVAIMALMVLACVYVAMSFKTSTGADLIITVNEPIE